MNQKTTRGFASLPIIIFLLVVAALVMTQANNSTSTRMSGDVVQSDSLAAFFLAESGVQSRQALLANAYDQITFDAACNALNITNTVSFGRGTINYSWVGLDSSTATGISKCTFRAAGRVNGSTRTIEKMVGYSQEKGTAGFSETNELGTDSLTTPLTVGSSVQAVAILTSAYRIKGSEGYDDYLSSIGSNSNAESKEACSPSCTVQWNLESSTGIPSVGSITIARNLDAATTRTTLSQSIYISSKSGATTAAPRNYVQVGALVTGTAPKLEGVYAALKETTSESASEYSKGTYINGSSQDLVTFSKAADKDKCSGNGGTCACYRSDVLVFAVAGRVDPKDLGTLYSASFDQMTFDTDISGYSGYNIPMELLSHYPGIDSATEGAQGDLFAEMWFAYNPLLYATIDKIITPASTKSISKVEFEITVADKIKDGVPDDKPYIRLFNDCTVSASGKTQSCNFPAKTKISSVAKITGKTLRYTIGIPWSGAFDPTLYPWAGKTLCGGVCAMQPRPSTAGNKANFVLHRATSSLNQYAGGFLCLSGVGKKPSPLLRQVVAGQRWREITSDD